MNRVNETGDGPRPWPRVGPEEIVAVDFLRIRRYLARSPRTGSARRIAVIDTFEWVNVVALTPEDDVLLVRQFRHGTGSVSLEIPGGIVDPGEDPAHAAARELREETGYEGGPPIFLGSVEPNPAILSNHCRTYLIEGCRKVGGLELDPGEDIEVVTMPLAKISDAIQDGRIAHALVVCAFWWLEDARRR
jgi:8-oxo-dGTP pyrophosphatase MutT (NUDIX family)